MASQFGRKDKIKTSLTRRQAALEQLRRRPEVSVLIVGGGINGAGLFRDLALQGVDVVLVEKSDFCSGASAAPSRMIHGGLRYLEFGEFRLVREALRGPQPALDECGALRSPAGDGDSDLRMVLRRAELHGPFFCTLAATARPIAARPW